MSDKIYCPSCHSDKHLSVIWNEVISVAPDSNVDKHETELPYCMAATVKCFNCGLEFDTICKLEFEVNPF